jgi:hypothetical protein
MECAELPVIEPFAAPVWLEVDPPVPNAPVWAPDWAKATGAAASNAASVVAVNNDLFMMSAFLCDL